VDLTRAHLAQDRGTLAQGGAGGEDVIDEEGFALHGPSCRVGARDVRAALRSGGLTWSLVLRTTFSLSKRGTSILPATPLAMSSAWLKPRLASRAVQWHRYHRVEPSAPEHTYQERRYYLLHNLQVAHVLEGVH
jgi:hypothetical protein